MVPLLATRPSHFWLNQLTSRVPLFLSDRLKVIAPTQIFLYIFTPGASTSNRPQ